MDGARWYERLASALRGGDVIPLRSDGAVRIQTSISALGDDGIEKLPPLPMSSKSLTPSIVPVQCEFSERLTGRQVPSSVDSVGVDSIVLDFMMCL